jgi:MFS transporter, DHA2 family, multidrug resistance protein
MTSASNASAPFQGNDKLLCGIILGVITFWLFAQTTLNIAPDMGKDLGLDASMMNIALAITALFSGIFIVVMGGLADRVGRVKIVKIGFYLSILGSLLVGFAQAGSMASPFLLTGRALQGLSGACIMPGSLALVKAYWDGAARQRAISLWSIGSWGGSGLCSLFGGLVTQNLGWRYIFFASVVVAVIGLILIQGTPESREGKGDYKFDFAGIIAFMIAMVALQILVTQGNRLGWTSLYAIVLIAAAVIFGFLFFRVRDADACCVRRFHAVQQSNIHRRYYFEFPAQRRCRHNDCVTATGATWWQYDSAASRHADSRLCGRDHRLHSRR